MNKSENEVSFDYSYLLTVAGIGGIFSCAALMAGFAFGKSAYGYYGCSAILLITAVILLGMIKGAQSVRLRVPTARDAMQNDNMGVAMLMTSTVGDVVYANKAAKTLFEKLEYGEPQSPLKIDISNKTTIENVLETLVVGKMKIIVAEIRDSGKYIKLEVEKVQKNGDFYSWRLFEDAQAEGPFSMGEAGPDQNKNMGRFFDKSDIGLMAINEKGKVTYLNSVLMKVFFDEDTPPELPFDLSLISRHSVTNLKNQVEFISRNGNAIFAQVKNWAVGSDDDTRCYLVVPEDASNIRGDQKNLNVDTEDGFFLSSPIGIAVVNREGAILEKNIVFGNFIGSLDLKENKNVTDILTQDSASLVFKEITNTLKSGKSSSKIELNFQGESDKQGQFYITNSGNHAPGNECVVIYLIDITEQKSLELQFSQSQKMQAVGQLAGGVAHDFNNLLTAIIGFCDLLLVKHGPGDQSFSDIIQIKQNANRAANLVRQLLAFSRQQTLRPKVLIMTDVVAELSNLLRRLIGSNIDLEMNHGRNIHPVQVDQGQLEQVIINLCVNARDAMPEGGKLEIKTRNINVEESLKIAKEYPVFPKGNYILLEVNDTGTGIAKEHIDRVFEPFFSANDVGKGTGLGRSPVYGIIKQTNGFVFPQSEMGIGTSFKIYLPEYVKGDKDEEDDDQGDVVEEKPAADLTGSSTILLVEDEDAVRMFASRALKNKGYTVFEADSGVSALKVMEETDAHIDLVISDVMMPQMDGPTLVKKIRETDTNLKVIFISGYAEDALDDNIMDKDFNFLSKPFSLKQLAEQVKEVLGN